MAGKSFPLRLGERDTDVDRSQQNLIDQLFEYRLDKDAWYTRSGFPLIPYTEYIPKITIHIVHKPTLEAKYMVGVISAALWRGGLRRENVRTLSRMFMEHNISPNILSDILSPSRRFFPQVPELLQGSEPHRHGSGNPAAGNTP